MNNKLILALSVTSALALSACSNGTSDTATDKHAGKFETCMQAALAERPGNVLTVEAEIENGKPIYEFDIAAADGKEWEVECDAASGKVVELEEEVAIDDPRFVEKAKVSLDDAKAAALAVHAGEIIETEYAIEADGGASYEFDIKLADGSEMEVEIDAETGKLEEEPELEVYQIGEEK
ncbi:PepSY domain-containing protein [Pseudomethylobacillus aquaticus]|uniref:PepSY domain-containing protein n=1 Tax=Pseudomethylobacillus aquaticus TaxID=2676064 RepID=UPI001F0218B6|nr:PepSY domain-containing protein [Pseudomethylobacillus aquaticus]